MASVATKISFTCPNCAKVLRSSTRPPKGKKVKCPACGEPFLPELDDEDEEATAIQSKPSVKSKAKAKAPSRDEEDDEDVKPRSKKRRADEDDDEDDDDAPRSKRRRDEDDEDEEDDRPIKKKKKAKKKSGSMMMIVAGVVVLGGGALLSCGLCGVGAFVWPGFMLSKADLEAFVPADADIVIGANPKLIKAKGAYLEKLMKEQMPMRQANQKMDGISDNSDKMLMFIKSKDMIPTPVILFVSNSSDIAKVKRNPDLGPAQTLGGHANVHKVTNKGVLDGLGNYVAFPGGDVVVVSYQSEADLIATLSRGKQKAQPNAALELGKPVYKSAFWIAITPDADGKRSLKQELEQAAANRDLPMPTLRNAAKAVDGIKGFTIACDFDDKQDIQLHAKAICKDAEDAKLFKTGVEDAWKVAHSALVLAGALKAPGMPDIPASVKEDMDTLKYSVEGSDASMKFRISAKTIEEGVKLIGGQQRNFGPGPGFGPGPIGPGPGPIGPGPKGGPKKKFGAVNLPPGQSQLLACAISAPPPSTTFPRLLWTSNRAGRNFQCPS
jgi:hypothetical protein